MFYRDNFLTNTTAVSLTDLIDLGICERDLEDLCAEFEDFCGPLFPILPNKREDLPTI